MRQNPMLQNRMQVGGRSMPAWFSASLVTQSRLGAPSPPPPPLPVEPPPEESDYEEIDHIPKSAMKKQNSRRTCSLCGNPNPAVSCEMCNNQIFCGSCNDMYHRHPKRQHHSRKILDPLENRPPIPPKTPVPHEMMQAQLPPLPPQHPGHFASGGIPTPMPPPRRKGRFGMRSAAGSPTTGLKSIFDPVGTLKRFMGGMAQRPLPPTPKQPPPLPPKPADLARSMTPTPRLPPMMGDRRLSSPQPFGQGMNDPRGRTPVAFEMHNARIHSMSVANLSGHTSSRDSGYPDWGEEDEEDMFTRNRAHSISSAALGRFPSTSQDASHFATMHRPGRNQRQMLQSQPQLAVSSQDAPDRPPPPLPPRQFPSQTQLSFQSSQSAFDLDRMAAIAQQQQQQFGGVPPWNYPVPGYPFDFQQAMMMGYPTGTMHRTPSTQSMGPTMNPSTSVQNQQFFGWGPMGFGPPMTPMEMEMMAAHHRRGSDMNLLPQQSQRAVPLSNPVTPQGSFRKKAGRHMSVEPEFTRRLERGLDLTQARRSETPSSFVRVQPISAASTPAPLQGKPKAPAKPPSDQSPDDSYFSAERQQLTESTASSESTAEITENPEGPWECEHCTFINPKSTKVCTICCKTPSQGYKAMKGRRGNSSAKFKNKRELPTQNLPNSKARDSSRDSSSANTGAEEVPVLKSKLSISREKAKINLVSKVENERVKTPGKSALKAGSSGTLKAGSVPPGLKVAVATSGAKKKVKGKQKQVVVSDDDSEEAVEDDDQNEEDEQSDEEEIEDEEIDNEEEAEPGDSDADDEDGVVNVKINPSKFTGRVASSRQGVSTGKQSMQSTSVGSGRTPKKFTKGRRANNAKKLVDSNEDVYGSVPIQTLAISPKIDIKRPSKTKVSTAVGSSPPKEDGNTLMGPVDKESDEVLKSTSPTNKVTKSSSGVIESKNKTETEATESVVDTTIEKGRESPIVSTIVVSSSSTKQKRSPVSKGSISKRNSVTATEESEVDSSPFQAKKEDASTATEGVKSTDTKNSVGTSPPPQSISTQTCDEALVVESTEATNVTASKTKSSSKTSLRSTEDFDPPRPIEMSEKALRYARKARNKEQQYQKLKRSMSTHLTYSAEPWLDSEEGRHLYRSSSRQSLASDTRSLPLSGPPSRESSPTPMSRYSGGGGGGSRGGWYEDFRRYPSSTMWESRHVANPPGDFLTSMEDLLSRRSRRESMRSQEFELTRLLKDAEESNFSPEDVQVAIRMCGDKNPIKWLQENWSSIVETVQTLATKYGREKGTENNDVGTVSKVEAKDSIRIHKGNVWAAVTDCVDNRRKKFHELQSRGNFLREDILTALTANHGNLEAAYVELSKAQLKPFLMRIYGPPSEPDNESAAPISSDEGKSMYSVAESNISDRSGSLLDGKVPISKNAGKVGQETTQAPQTKIEEIPDSNAHKVMEEIGKKIQELNISESYTLEKSSISPKTTENSSFPVELQSNQESEAEPSPIIQQIVKSDDGEDESFVDAVSESASNANSPPPLPLPPSHLETELESEVNNVDGEVLLGEEFEEEDVLEIEIDDTEANISDFIQNYEIVPAAEEKENQRKVVENKSDEKDTEEEGNNGGITKVEIEQLLTTLTSTFSEMEQFAHKIKANIATEIQQQLAAATANVKSSDPSEDGSYEPVALPPGIEENVNKKVAKYQRLAAKKKQKTARHKSPESLGFPLGQEKEPSVSPLPSTSTRERDTLEKVKPDQEENSDQGATAGSRLSDYEEVEISQEEEVEDGDVREEEFVEEEANESSIVEESEEELVIEVEDEVEEEEEEEEEDLDGIENYGEVYTDKVSSGVVGTPSDTDKVIVANVSVSEIPNATLEDNSVVIVEETLSSESPEEKKTEGGNLNQDENTPASRLIKEGKVDNNFQAELALHLLEMSFSEEDAFSAAKECSSLSSALSFLQQECGICAGKFNAKEMVSMLRCTHLCCKNCARDYFTVQVRDKAITQLQCPFCSEPSTLSDDAEIATEYFNHLDILLKNLLDNKQHEMFQRKLRDWTLAKTPNFKWCSKCSSGFITEPLQTRLVCPDCRAVTCAVCLEPWDKVNHDHRDDSGKTVKLCDTSTKSIIEYLNANCIECPRCHFRFSLARGGCMHLTCTQCHYEFCSGCAAPFRMGEKCEAKFPICDKLGLHAHHPRNCLFYLRDKEPDVLSKLLEDNAIPYFKESSGEVSITESGTETAFENKKPQRVCQVPIQKETSDGYMDDICGKEAPAGYATVCKTHYIEYLGLLIWQNRLDPITILTNDDLEVIVRRAYKKHPGRPNWLSDEGFRKRLLKVINEEIPL